MEDTLYLTRQDNDRKWTICTKTAVAVSNMILSWTQTAQGSFTIDASDLTEASIDAFVIMINSLSAHRCDTIPLSTSNDMPINANNVHLLVKPLHKYDCPGLWRQLCQFTKAYPTIAAVRALDAVEDVRKGIWANDNVLRFAYNHLPRRKTVKANEDTQDNHDTQEDQFSPALCVLILDFITQRATFKQKSDVQNAACYVLGDGVPNPKRANHIHLMVA